MVAQSLGPFQLDLASRASVESRARRCSDPTRAMRIRWLATVISLTVLFVAPVSRVSAQGLGWGVATSAIIDTEFTDGAEVGPGLTGEIEVQAEGLLSYSVVISVARTDFPVAADELHRNLGAVALGVRLMRDREGPSVGLVLGIGALFWDDVSETDPAFRSSAQAEEMLLPGVEVRWPLGGDLGLSFSVRDQLTGWWWAILDPSEGELNHRLIVAVGLYHG